MTESPATTEPPDKTDTSTPPPPGKARRRTAATTAAAEATTTTAAAPADPADDELQRVTSERDALLRLLVDQLGGYSIFEAATLHYRDGLSINQVAAWASIPPTTCWRRVSELRRVLASAGLCPPAWRRPHAGRARKPRTRALPHDRRGQVALLEREPFHVAE